MIASRPDKRTQLIGAALELVHEQGFERTTLADIAERSGTPLGNLYYYFKTKDDIGQAIIEQRTSEYETLRRKWNTLPNPRSRLDAFIRMTFDSREMLAESGCPVGTLCAELHKQRGPLATNATQLFADMLTWTEAQFREMGFGGESGDLAVHLLSALQGASVLTHSFGDPKFMGREAQRLRRWLGEIAPTRARVSAKHQRRMRGARHRRSLQ